ncbi:hypothetical protein VNO78_31150 [Psophocarpus tetragonolobus]|uniref:Uncharacterized protein n=1 Tax=Psophocarpus tetragonolobus TaxID=3891 RepID=A0AAN9RYB2_PSOTE
MKVILTIDVECKKRVGVVIMGTRWRRAFCTSEPESTIDTQDSPSSGSCVRLGFLQPQSLVLTSNDTPTFQTKSSPLSVLKNTFKFRTSCGICSNSVKTGQGTAIYTAECGHAFHFPCLISLSHARSHLCPVCHATWNQLPLQQNDAPQTHSYHDDEPLFSSLSSSAQILPIPEEDENPLSSSPPLHSQSTTVRVKLMPECAVVSLSQTHQTRAFVLRLKAPPPPPPPRLRPPMDLLAVLALTNGMTAPKLHMLKRAMRLVISSLAAADRLAVVAFSANPQRLLPLTRMTPQGQRAARRVLDRLLCPQGNGSAEEAIQKAAKVLEDRRERNPLGRILLLSDGHHDSKSKNQRRRFSHVSFTPFACIEVPVHSFGFETNKTGLIHEPLDDDFAQYVDRTLSVAVQDFRIQLGFSSPAEIRAVYSCSGGPTALSTSSARLGDLYAEEEKELLVEVRVPTSALGTLHVMTVRCVNKDPASHEFVYGAEHAFTVVPPKNTSVCSGKVERLRNVFITSRAVAESRRLAKHNEFSSAHHLLASARALLLQFGSAEEYVRGLEAELAELQWRKQQRNEREVEERGEVLTPTSAWRAAEKLAKMARMKKSLNKVSDLHGFENARF